MLEVRDYLAKINGDIAVFCLKQEFHGKKRAQAQDCGLVAPFFDKMINELIIQPARGA